MAWCETSELSRYVLKAYLDKIDEIETGTTSGHVALVSGEIDEALLQGGWTVPDTPDSAVLTRICAVMAAWRCVGNITSLMDGEASSGNEWLPLQKLNTRAEKDLDAIRAGKLDPFPGADDEAGISVVTRPQIFDDRRWRDF